jgi:hypothetical protein
MFMISARNERTQSFNETILKGGLDDDNSKIKPVEFAGVKTSRLITQWLSTPKRELDLKLIQWMRD